MNIRITLSRPTVKAMHVRLQQAYARGDVRLVRRISALLEHLLQQTTVNVLSQRWGFSVSCFYLWLNALILDGVASLVYQHGGGRPAKLTPSQKKQLCAWLDTGPQAVGFASACWTTLLIQELIRREFQVLYNRFYVCELLRTLGYSFQKAQLVSDHLDEQRRRAWKAQQWPQILREARRRGALILFGDEAYFPQMSCAASYACGHVQRAAQDEGSLSYTWARRGQTPQVKTAGKRRAYKTFGLIEFFSGRFFYQGIEGKFNTQSYQAFLLSVLAQTTEHLFLIQDGARYHTSKAMKAFFVQHQERLTVYQLPSYSPDFNPIEYLWRNVKKQATHNRYFAQFQELISSVEQTLRGFAQHACAVLHLFAQYCDDTGLARQIPA